MGVAALSPLSYSSVRTYLECPLRWKFLYIDRIPETPRGYFSFGRTVHSVLEALLRPLAEPAARRLSAIERQRTLDEWRTFRESASKLPMSRDELLALYNQSWLREGYSSPEEEDRYRALGAEILLRYYDHLSEELPRPVAIEEHLEARWDGIQIHGYLDRIDRRPSGGLEIVDYKTSRELSSEEARSSDQLSLYQVLAEKNYTEPVERLTLYHLRSLTPYATSPRGAPELGELHERVGYVYDGIRSELFEPTPGRPCLRCEFKALCPEFREVPEGDRQRLAELVDRFHELRTRETHVAAELKTTADALHQEAERLGVHRLPGTKSTALRRREEAWQFASEELRATMERYGLSDRLLDPTPEEVRRLLRDPTIDPEARRSIAETGSRKVRWYWELDEADS